MSDGNSDGTGIMRQQEKRQPAPPRLLDKEGLAAKLLECADEKIVKTGQVQYANDAKDRLGFFRLYAEVMGFVGKASIDATANNFTNNEMKVVLVKPETKHDNKAIERTVNKVGESATIVPLIIRPV